MIQMTVANFIIVSLSISGVVFSFFSVIYHGTGHSGQGTKHLLSYENQEVSRVIGFSKIYQFGFH